MKSTFAVRTKVNIDDTTALMDISWDCPYCELSLISHGLHHVISSRWTRTSKSTFDVNTVTKR